MAEEIPINNNLEVASGKDLDYVDCSINFLRHLAPQTLTSFLSYLFLNTTQSFVGSKTADHHILSAMGIGRIYLAFTLLPLIQGLMAGFETLGGNAFGANKKKTFAVYYWRAIVSHYLIILPILILNICFFDTLCSILCNDPITQPFVKTYLQYALYTALFEGFICANSVFLTTIGKDYINYIIFFISLSFHLANCWFWIDYLDLGIMGGGIAQTVTNLFH